LHLEGVTTHLIGHLQTNKVKSIVGTVDMIQSVDSERVAKAIDAASQSLGITTDILIEVNVGREPQKAGVLPEELPLLLEKAAVMQGIRVKGLMTVPPILETEYEKRKIFSQMFRLFIDNQSKKLDNIDMQILSMGMSDDYPIAIEEGATMVRVGSKIFGARNYNI
jgi:pyridoxal phosphate enzyme (YggS family)